MKVAQGAVRSVRGPEEEGTISLPGRTQDQVTRASRQSEPVRLGCGEAVLILPDLAMGQLAT
jgi:hypothetical protein